MGNLDVGRMEILSFILLLFSSLFTCSSHSAECERVDRAAQCLTRSTLFPYKPLSLYAP